MKRICLLIALTGVMASYQCWALTVNITRDAGVYAQQPGGEFTVTLDPSDAGDPVFQSILSHYDASTIVNGGFETFCLSSTTELLGNPQNATLTPNGVTLGTAWLYSQFVNQTLAGYTWAPGAGRVASAWDLQNAIWELQGTPVYDLAAAAGYYNLAVAFFGGAANAELAANGVYNIDAFVLTHNNADGRPEVSQPMLVAVPDGGATVMLLGLALSGFCFVSRKVRA
jgi:hypothetical protein